MAEITIIRCDLCKEKEVKKKRNFERSAQLVELDVCDSCVVDINRRIQKSLDFMGRPHQLKKEMVDLFLVYELQKEIKL